jgi:E3 ubiquitin-protein ligase CCNP1IP1
MQKQLDNVVREGESCIFFYCISVNSQIVANSEINLLNEKNLELERDLEIERRKVRELQDAARERDKEYQKLKVILR